MKGEKLEKTVEYIQEKNQVIHAELLKKIKQNPTIRLLKEDYGYRFLLNKETLEI